MTVAELREKLDHYPDRAEVLIRTDGFDCEGYWQQSVDRVDFLTLDHRNRVILSEYA